MRHNNKETDLFLPDPWLAGILGYPVYNAADPLALAEEQDGKVQHFLHTPCLVCARLDVDQLGALNKLLHRGFCLVDTAVTFRASWAAAADVNPALVVRKARPSDLTAVADMAGEVFTESRFYKDPRITRSQASRINREWAANFFCGKRGDEMLVAEKDGVAAGFISLLVKQAGEGVIDLIGVHPSARGAGVGSALLSAAPRLVPQIKSCTVTTQIANRGAIRLYQKFGFDLVEAKYVLHVHGPVGRKDHL